MGGGGAVCVCVSLSREHMTSEKAEGGSVRERVSIIVVTQYQKHTHFCVLFFILKNENI